MYTINKITEIPMDTRAQKSIVDVVNKIVNVQPEQIQGTDDPVSVLAETIEQSMEVFEERFQFPLTEEQEEIFTDLVINFVKDREQIETVDLNESTEDIIEKYSPEQVFLSIFEDISQKDLFRQFVQQYKQGVCGSDGRVAPDGSIDPTSTLSPFSANYQMTQQAMADVRADPTTRNINRYMSEEATHPLKKHKKKLYKITFMDKGVKKRGTAVSHKGVMRIVSGKKHFKVYDERNRDVTSQFSSGKKEKK